MENMFFKHPPHWREYFTRYPNGFTLMEMLSDWASKANILASEVESINKFLEDLEVPEVGTPVDLEPILESIANIQTNLQTINTNHNELKDNVENTFDIINLSLNSISNRVTNNEQDIQELFSLTSNGGYKTSLGINVMEFNADPTGQTDSTQAFQAAQLACNTTGRNLHIPEGTFLISSPLEFPQGYFIKGQGISSIIHANFEGEWLFSSTGDGNYGGGIQGLGLVNIFSVTGGIKVEQDSHSLTTVIKDVTFMDFERPLETLAKTFVNIKNVSCYRLDSSNFTAINTGGFYGSITTIDTVSVEGDWLAAIGVNYESEEPWWPKGNAFSIKNFVIDNDGDGIRVVGGLQGVIDVGNIKKSSIGIMVADSSTVSISNVQTSSDIVASYARLLNLQNILYFKDWSTPGNPPTLKSAFSRIVTDTTSSKGDFSGNFRADVDDHNTSDIFLTDVITSDNQNLYPNDRYLSSFITSTNNANNMGETSDKRGERWLIGNQFIGEISYEVPIPRISTPSRGYTIAVEVDCDSHFSEIWLEIGDSADWEGNFPSMPRRMYLWGRNKIFLSYNRNFHSDVLKFKLKAIPNSWIPSPTLFIGGVTVYEGFNTFVNSKIHEPAK